MIYDVYWGFNSSEYLPQITNSSKKRCYGEFSDLTNLSNKTKLSELSDNCEIYDPLIYTFGKTLHFSSGINKITIEIVIKHICTIIEEFYTECESKGEDLVITYIVDSPGGSVTSILKFVDFLQMAKKNYPRLQFKSIISGLAASAGTIMACVADQRSMTINAKSMIHDLSTSTGGSYTQLMAHTDFLRDLNDALVNIYASKSKKSKEELTEMLKSNKWFNAEQYLEYGFIDKIEQ